MARVNYGIDLGTTNSAIAHFEKGETVIKKSPTQGDTTPSCVAVSPVGRILVGQKAFRQYQKDLQLSFVRPGYSINSFVEFKRQMGTDESFYSSNAKKDFSPEELSSEVLKELKKYDLSGSTKCAVITVPAMFENTQKDATKRAAKLAGFDYVELIQEPVAASIAYGLTSKMKDAYWLVFDFGGGTFDAALMKIEDGIPTPIGTAGNNKLGGKDIDKAIVEQLFIPYFREHYSIDSLLAQKGDAFKNEWKAKAEEAKIQLSFNESFEVETDLGDDYGCDDNGEAFELCMTLTQEEFEPIAAPIYQKAIDITKELLKKHNLQGSQLGAIVLVGGPTHSPIVRKMLREQITPNVDTSIDPMTCVAEGAALYASTLEIPEVIQDESRDRSKVQLDVNVKGNSVEDSEFAFVALRPDKCDNYSEQTVDVEFVRTDGAFQTGKICVGADGEAVELRLVKDKTNVFKIHCFDASGNSLECEPGEISILPIGGTDAVMPLFIGIGVANDKGDEIFKKIDGLEKNHMLPADGVCNGLRTQKAINAGVVEDEIRITIYQTDSYNENTRALYCNRQYDVVFNGDDIPGFLPINSEVNIRMHADKSGSIDSFVINIPYLDFDLDVTDRVTSSTLSAVSNSFILTELRNASNRAKEANADELVSEIASLKSKYESMSKDRDSVDAFVEEMKQACRKVDDAYAKGEWDRVEKELRDIFEEVEKDVEKYGNSQAHNIFEQLKARTEDAIEKKDVASAKVLTDNLHAFDYKLAEIEYFISWIYGWNRNFEISDWSNPARARQLVNSGLSIINNGPTADQLRPIIRELISLLPDDQAPDMGGGILRQGGQKPS